jgi:UDP-N-acetylmuramoyl-tripeptide--D-alanyl-D-alanine ligase
MDIARIHSLFMNCKSVSIDTRKIELNSFFVALKGDRFDANIFAEALGKGASYVIIDDENYYIDERTILVEDSLSALQELAKFHRKYLNLPIIALTGSNGKQRQRVDSCRSSKKYRTKQRLVTSIIISRAFDVIILTAETEIGIVEMGANHKMKLNFFANYA